MSTQVTIITSYGQTDRGLQREENEDSFMVNASHNIFAVADGLGGLPGGSRASTLAIEVLETILAENYTNGPVSFTDYFKKINNAVTEESKETYGEDIGMATTLTVAQVIGKRLHIGHIGDTGIFLFRDGECKQLTIDHTMAQEIRDRIGPDSETTIPDYYNHTLTRCIGHSADLSTDTYDFDLQKDDRVIIFSDGVTKTWTEDELAEKIDKFSSPEDAVREIINIGNERGGPDNITAIALFVN